MAEARPNVLVVDALDPSGGEGFIVDVRVAEKLGTRPVGVVTATTEQTTSSLRQLGPVSAELLGDQLRAILGDVEVQAVKIGALGTPAAAAAVAEALSLTAAPVVWDPVVRGVEGGTLLYANPLQAPVELFEHATVVTPMPEELGFLSPTNMLVADPTVAVQLGQEISAARNVEVLVQGWRWPHRLATSEALLFVHCHAGKCKSFEHETLLPSPVRGCRGALSMAIAAHLARGESVADAIAASIAEVLEWSASAILPGRGGPTVL